MAAHFAEVLEFEILLLSRLYRDTEYVRSPDKCRFAGGEFFPSLSVPDRDVKSSALGTW